MTTPNKLLLIAVGTVVVVVVIVWLLDVQLPMQSVPITTNFVSLNPAQAMYIRYNIVIKFVSDFRQDCGFLRVFQFPPPIKLTAMI